MDLKLSTEKTQFLLGIARDAIATQLKNKPLHLVENFYPEFEAVQGIFVTLTINKQLRGCIGNVIGQFPLYIGAQNMAIQAAFNDPRFPSLNQEEFDLIHLEISILSPLLPIHQNLIEVGKHGLLLRFQGHSGVFLPQVPIEQGWNKKQYLEALAQKAGLNGDVLNHKDIELFGFTATVIKEAD